MTRRRSGSDTLRLMRGLAAATLTILLIAGLSAQQGARPDPGASQNPPRRRIITVLSDVLMNSPLEACPANGRTAKSSAGLRVATWNIHAGRDVAIDEIAGELKAMHADIIALQEVDFFA